MGTRPQLIKHKAFTLAAEGHFNIITVNTQQHIKLEMNQIFLDELSIDRANFNLITTDFPRGKRLAEMIDQLELIVSDEQPDAVIVYGDTDSTLAGALIASIYYVPLIHIEAGMRSYNRRMPEEINRRLTDHASDLHLVSNHAAELNLRREGIDTAIYVVGDLMKDLVNQYYPFVEKKEVFGYYYATLHRPANTQNKERILSLLNMLNELNKVVYFSMHPRFTSAMFNYGIKKITYENIKFIGPQSYLDNLRFQYEADAIITDSGGMQKEAYWLKTKCITVRKETEWIETLNGNANQLLFDDLGKMQSLLNEDNIEWTDNLYGDGFSGDKIVNRILEYLNDFYV